MRAALLTKYPARYDNPLEQHINGTIQAMFRRIIAQRRAAARSTIIQNNLSARNGSGSIGQQAGGNGRGAIGLQADDNDVAGSAATSPIHALDATTNPIDTLTSLLNKKQRNATAPEFVHILKDATRRDSNVMPRHGFPFLHQAVSSQGGMTTDDLPKDAAVRRLVTKLRRNRVP